MDEVVIRIKKELKEKGEQIIPREERIIERRVKVRKERWKIIEIYVSGELKSRCKICNGWRKKRRIRKY